MWEAESALLGKSCHLSHGGGGDCPGHQAGGTCQRVPEPMIILPPGLSVCKKCREILLTEVPGEIQGQNIRDS